jgi:hypothetical protein
MATLGWLKLDRPPKWRIWSQRSPGEAKVPLTRTHPNGSYRIVSRTRPLFRQMQERLDGVNGVLREQITTGRARFPPGRELRPFAVLSLYHNYGHFAFQISD